MNPAKKIKTMGLLSFALVTAFSVLLSIFAGSNIASADFARPSTGVIRAVLNPAPSGAVTVTATRSADIPSNVSSTGKTIKAETVTLHASCSTSTGATSCSNIYSSDTLPYTGNAQTGGVDPNNSWQTFLVRAAGTGVSGSKSVHFWKGGTQTVTIVTGNTAQTGSIKGTAKYDDNTVCGSGSDYTLYPSGQGHLQATTPLAIDQNGNYTIGGQKAGTYDLVIYCKPNNGSDGSFQKQSVTVTAGQTTTLDFNTNGTSSSGGSDDNKSSIDCDFSDNPLTWIVCPVVDGINSAASTLDSIINNQLQFDPSNYGQGSTTNGTQFFDKKTDGSNPYYTAWSSFRVIATALIVIAGLVMVASQALGFEILDAYTVRKTLPRLLVAIIGISLSWPIMSFIVGFFNTLGADIGQLMFAPFKDSAGGASGFSLFAHNIANATTATGVGATLLLGGLGLGIIGALSFGVTAILALLIGFVIIIARNVALIMILILAPIGIAAYILPNTQKLWKLWYDNFLGLLLVYPIIAAMIAAGKIFSWAAFSGITGNTDFTTATPLYIMGFAAYLLPYFALPFAFRLATGVIGTIAGLMNDRSKGAFDRLKKFRGAKTAENLGKLKTGTRFADRNPLTRTFNRTTGGVGAGYKGNFGLGKRGREAYDQSRRGVSMELMKSPAWAAIQHDDDALRALTYDSAAKARAAGVSSRAIAAAQASVGFGRPQALAAAQQMSATGTAFSDVEDVAQTIARASGGNASSIASLAGFINSDTKRNGRHDLAPGFGTLNDLSRQAAGLGSSGAGEGGRPATYREARENAWNSGSLYLHANDKSANLQAAVSHFRGELNSGDQARVEKGAVFLRELQAMAPNATGDNKKVIDSALDEMGGVLNAQAINPTTGGPMEREVRRLDPTDPNKYVYDTHNVTIGDLAAPKAREYQRPDPNNLG